MGAVERKPITANKVAAAAGIRRSTGTQNGCIGTRTVVVESLCRPASEDTRKGLFGRKSGVSFSDTNGANVGEIMIPFDRPMLDSGNRKWNSSARHPGRGSTVAKGKWVSIKTLPWAHAT